MCPVNDFSYHCLNRFFAIGLALAVVLLSLNKLRFNTISLLFSNLYLTLIHFFSVDREWSHVRLPLRIEVITLKSLLVWRQSSDMHPLNLETYPKLLRICRGAMCMFPTLPAASNLEKCALD